MIEGVNDVSGVMDFNNVGRDAGRGVNGTVLTQRGKGLFTEGRWRKQSIAEILALNTHIKRHPGVESCGEAPRCVEQKNSHYVGHVCFIGRLLR